MQDQKNAKLTAIAQTETTLTQLEATAPIGRVVVHIPARSQSLEKFGRGCGVARRRCAFDPEEGKLCDGLGTSIITRPQSVTVRAGALSGILSQAGGLTQIGDKDAVFVVRADGSVIAAKNNSAGWWAGNPLSAALKPGDSIVVPEKTPKIGTRNWATTPAGGPDCHFRRPHRRLFQAVTQAGIGEESAEVDQYSGRVRMDWVQSDESQNRLLVPRRPRRLQRRPRRRLARRQKRPAQTRPAEPVG